MQTARLPECQNQDSTPLFHAIWQGVSQHPAQDRLKRLQGQLKRVQDNEKEQGTTKRITHSSSASRRSSASTSTPQRLLKFPPKVAMNAWEKPKALVDANRLKAGRTQTGECPVHIVTHIPCSPYRLPSLPASHAVKSFAAAEAAI